jgi:branched-chain amino acid transport system permease protein
MLTILGGQIGLAAFIGLVASLISLSLLYIMLTRTRTGLALRAASENKNAARLLGIKVSRMNNLALGLSGMLGFIAGTFLSTFFYIYPTIGSLFLTRMFVIVVLGGLGNIVGALVGGLVIGETEVLTSFALGAQWSQFISMMIFVLILLLRPKGIFGVKLK